MDDKSGTILCCDLDSAELDWSPLICPVFPEEMLIRTVSRITTTVDKDARRFTFDLAIVYYLDDDFTNYRIEKSCMTSIWPSPYTERTYGLDR
ncbi:hypothetical protein FRB99_002011 [Tulasnella sp. 403]|nr:hypothetical protein FRB99_002011 [Tulasnella sp. 403]